MSGIQSPRHAPIASPSPTSAHFFGRLFSYSSSFSLSNFLALVMEFMPSYFISLLIFLAILPEIAAIWFLLELVPIFDSARLFSNYSYGSSSVASYFPLIPSS
jgi:hypothetical protein